MKRSKTVGNIYSYVLDKANAAIAGMPMKSVAGTQTGVYAGSMTDDYAQLSTGDPFDLGQNSASGISRAMLANRVSWFFDLRGPSVTLDTACSSSLYALHLACQSLRLGETEQALVCGANLVLSPNYTAQLSQMRMVSPDGMCHTFDARANGYARGEAIGAVVVKTLRRALQDGDTIRAVVRATGAGQDGRTPGITAPSGPAQAALIRQTYAAAGLSLEDTGYVEAHGTGTQAGDPVELVALRDAFLGGPASASRCPLVVGSVKPNVGHTEGAAGIAGLIKVVLALERALIPPLAGFDTLNPRLAGLVGDGRLVVPAPPCPQPWPGPPAAARRASLNSFGFGGANCHVVVDDAHNYLATHGLPPRYATTAAPAAVGDKHGTQLFVFSAHDRAGVRRQAARYAAFLRREPSVAVRDFSYTLASRRSQLPFRSYAVAASLGELAAALADGMPASLHASATAHRLIFVFTGQGAQWPAMGCELLRSSNVFRTSISRSQAILDSLGADWRIEDFLSDPADTRLDQPRFCQPVCSVLQLALVDQLRHWNITPSATVGHSSGELASAYAARLVRFEDAVRIAYFRGVFCEEAKLRLQANPGTMLAAGVSEAEALECLRLVPKDTAWIGCINSPASVTLSGDVDSIEQLEAILKKRGKFARRLRVQLAYHSPRMQVVANDFFNAISNVEPCPLSSTLMFSSVTGKRVEGPASVDARFWTENMLASVKFNAAVSTLLESRIDGYHEGSVPWSAAVEIGPNPSLKAPFEQVAAASGSKGIAYTGVLIRGHDSVKSAMTAAGFLWSLGHLVDLVRVNEEDGRTDSPNVLTTLPPYAWNHAKGFWHESAAARSARLRKSPRTDLLGAPVPNQNPMQPAWRNFLQVSESPWIKEHVITGTILYPAAGMLVMAIEAAVQMASRPVHGIRFHDVNFEKGLAVPAGDQFVEVSLSMQPHEQLADWFRYTVFSRSTDGSWIKHSWGKITILYQDDAGVAYEEVLQAADWVRQHERDHSGDSASIRQLEPAAFYDQLHSIGIEYGNCFRNLTHVKVLQGEQKAIVTFAIPDTKSIMPHNYEYPHLVHPAMLDAIFHSMYPALGDGSPIMEAAIPQKIADLFVSAGMPNVPGTKLAGVSHVSSMSARGAVGSICVFDDASSSPLVIVQDMTLTKVSSAVQGRPPALAPSTSLRRNGCLIWKNDVDFISRERMERFMSVGARVIKGLGQAAAELSVWLDLACHKRAELNVLLLQGAAIWEDGLGLLSSFAPRAGQRRGFQSCSVIGNNLESIAQLKKKLAEASMEVMCEAVDVKTNGLERIQSFGKFDFVLASIDFNEGGNEALLSLSSQLLLPGGHVALLSAFREPGRLPQEDQIKTAGFDHLVAVVDHPSSQLVIAATPADAQPAVDVSELSIIEHPRPSPTAKRFASNLSRRLHGLGIHVKTCNIANADQLGDKAMIISLLELEEPLVSSWNAQEFEMFRKLISARYVLWITRGGLLDAGERSLQFAPTTGLLRTLRVEMPQIVLPHLDVSPSVDLAHDEAVSLVLAAFRSSTQGQAHRKNDMEYAASTSGLFVPRVQAADALDREIELHSSNIKPTEGPLCDGIRRKAVVSRPGDMSSLHWAEDDDAERPLTNDEVEFRTTHIALNQFGVDRSLQGADSTTAFRHGAVGFVTRLGPDASGLALGQRIFTIVPDAFKTHIRQPKQLVCALPEHLTAAAAASLPMIFATAWQALIVTGGFMKGNSVLVDVGTPSVDQAIVQLVQMLGGRLLLSLRSGAHEDMFVSNLRVPKDDIIIGSSNPTLASRAAAITSNDGFDLIISSAPELARSKFLPFLRNGGRMVDLSRNTTAAYPDGAVPRNNASFASANTDSLSPKEMFKLVKAVMELISSCNIAKCHPNEISSVADLGVAISAANPGTTVKLPVVSFYDDAVVWRLPPQPPKLALSPDATYVLSGGLGALGLVIAEDMISHGARHLVFLSRSGASRRSQKEALKSFAERGCATDVIPCDVTDAVQVERASRSCTDNSWKVRGIIQCAMVLQVFRLSKREDLHLTACAGLCIRKHDVREMVCHNQPKSQRHLEPSLVLPIRRRLFCHPFFDVRHHGQCRPGKLQRWQHL